MDHIDLRSIITTVSFLCFVGIVFWAYSNRQKSRFDEAANLPFADDEMQERTLQHAGLKPTTQPVETRGKEKHNG